MHVRISAFVASIIAVLAISSAGASAHPRKPRCGRTCRLLRLYEPYTGTVGGEGWPVYSGRFAVPACIVNAESHGLLHEHSHPWGSSGLYQLELSNWEYYKRRGWPEFPYQGSKLQQSIVAYDVLHSQGIHAWTTAYGCGY